MHTHTVTPVQCAIVHSVGKTKKKSIKFLILIMRYEEYEKKNFICWFIISFAVGKYIYMRFIMR